MKCVWCGEDIKPGELPPNAPLAQMHKECVVRSIFGSMAHIRKQCSCFGGDKTDDDILPGLTKRQQAKMAYVSFCAHPPNPFAAMPPRERAKLRPENFNQLSGEQQWEIDKALGILDWDGK